MLWIALVIGILCILCSKEGDLRLLGGAILLIVAGCWLFSLVGWVGGQLPSLPSMDQVSMVCGSVFDFLIKGLKGASYFIAVLLFLCIAGPLQFLMKLFR